MKNGFKALLTLSLTVLLASCAGGNPESSSNTSSAASSQSEVPSSEVVSSEEASSEDVSSVEVVDDTDKKVVISELTTGDIVEDVTKDCFTFVKNGDNTEEKPKKAMTVADLETPTVVDEVSYTKVLKTQSASSTAADKLARVIKFTATGKGKVTLVAKSGSAEEERSIGVYSATKGVEHDSVKVGAEASKVELTFHYGSEYYITSNANVSIYEISVSWEDGVNEDWEPAISLADANFLNVGELPAQTYKKSVTAGNFVVNAVEKYTKEDGTEGAGTVIVESNSKTYDGVTYTQRMKLGGAGTRDYRSITMNVTGACRVTVICCSSSSSANRVANFVKLGATAADDVVVSETTEITGTVNGYVYSIDEAGSYNFAAKDGGINVYGITIEYLS